MIFNIIGCKDKKYKYLIDKTLSFAGFAPTIDLQIYCYHND